VCPIRRIFVSKTDFIQFEVFLELESNLRSKRGEIYLHRSINNAMVQITVRFLAILSLECWLCQFIFGIKKPSIYPFTRQSSSFSFLSEEFNIRGYLRVVSPDERPDLMQLD